MTYVQERLWNIAQGMKQNRNQRRLKWLHSRWRADFSIAIFLLLSSLICSFFPPNENRSSAVWEHDSCGEAVERPSDRPEIYANSAQTGDTCHQPHQSGAVSDSRYPWHSRGYEEHPFQTNDHMQDANTSSSNSSMESKHWQKKPKLGRSFLTGAGLHAHARLSLINMYQPSIHQSVRPSVSQDGPNPKPQRTFVLNVWEPSGARIIRQMAVCCVYQPLPS